jgi:diguanylate cyclase (GGDEF)-like protein
MGRARRRRWTHDLMAPRTPEIWTLAGLFVGGSMACLLGARFPLSPDTPVELGYTCAAIAAGLAAVLWLFGDAVGRALLNGAVIVGVLVTSVIVASAATPQGATLTAFAYLLVAVYTAHFFSRREAWLHAGLVSVAYAIAVVVNDLPRTGATYVIVVGTMWAAVAVLGSQVSHMRIQADTDPLTGLLNRAGFRVAAEREHALALRTGTPLAMVLLDLDGFKAINDRAGHAAGDRLLAELAVRWKTSLRSCDILGRHGGDEFVLLLPATTPAQAEVALDRLRASTPVGFSAGTACWERDEGMEACLARADKGLYVEKDRRATSSTP